MKTDEPTKHGDVSPISGSISNLVDASKPPSRKKEATSERLQNFSRVTPQQLMYISFPLDSRYQPVRPVSMNSISRPKKSSAEPGETYTGVGGILVLLDERPEEPVDLIAPLEPPVVAPAPVAAQPTQPAQTTAARPHIALDEDLPEAPPPAPFEVSSAVELCSSNEHFIDLCVCSIPLATTRRRRSVIVSKDTCRIIIVVLQPSKGAFLMCDSDRRRGE
jgi:26S proteasome regulatory subunit N2